MPEAPIRTFADAPIDLILDAERFGGAGGIHDHGAHEGGRLFLQQHQFCFDSPVFKHSHAGQAIGPPGPMGGCSLPVVEADSDSEVRAEMRWRVDGANLTGIGKPGIDGNPPIDKAIVLWSLAGGAVGYGENVQVVAHAFFLSCSPAAP